MPRRKLPEEKKKVRLHITVDKKVAEVANATGNASEWINTVCKEKIEEKKKVIR